MSVLAACPPPEDLHRLLLGQISDEEAAALEQHFADCRSCSDTVQNLRVEDTLVAMMRSQAAIDEQPERGAVEQLIVRLKALPGSTLGPLPDGSEADLHSFLAPPQASDELGRLGAYRILRVIGSGGMGIVYEAEDPQLQRRVALKVVRPALAAQPLAMQRLLREARATAALARDDEHFAAILQIAEERGLPYLVMPLLEGESLEDRLRRDGRLPVAEAMWIGGEIALALAFAHERGLIHRDIKPSNIWLEAIQGNQQAQGQGDLHTLSWPAGRAYRIKLLDFGLARAATDSSRLTQTGIILGTPAYMAPEQARGEGVDNRSDLFSLGCVLYRLLVVRPQHHGHTAQPAVGPAGVCQSGPGRSRRHGGVRVQVPARGRDQFRVRRRVGPLPLGKHRHVDVAVPRLPVRRHADQELLTSGPPRDLDGVYAQTHHKGTKGTKAPGGR